ncbi:hypothetical protein [Aliiroseovarius sp. F20344]|uniref:hypothetical protein n=1 Tax=Aliiroseovarius sp. F20344 TaxID=2926414 RepID=UPI001FF6472B|nr:hypothetical protein [Aliiroseovarius sp. F20344]MCK0142245.1 hypothetical protein [Aliiroseovarius sp. F20344]
MKDTMHNDASSLREQYLEYGFLGELCREMWMRGIEMDILRSHTDRSGYDILLEANGVERHVQMKSSFIGAKTARQKINVRLADKPSGCVIWVRFDPGSLKLTEFLWFGAPPGEPLPDLGNKIGKHEKGDQHGYKAQRAAIRVINKGRFVHIPSLEKLADRLFGPNLT